MLIHVVGPWALSGSPKPRSFGSCTQLSCPHVVEIFLRLGSLNCPYVFGILVDPLYIFPHILYDIYTIIHMHILYVYIYIYTHFFSRYVMYVCIKIYMYNRCLWNPAGWKDLLLLLELHRLLFSGLHRRGDLSRRRAASFLLYWSWVQNRNHCDLCDLFVFEKHLDPKVTEWCSEAQVVQFLLGKLSATSSVPSPWCGTLEIIPNP